MNRRIIALLVLALPLVAQDATPPPRPMSRAQTRARAYDPATEGTFQGVVKEVKTLPMGRRHHGVHLLVEVEGKVLEAQLGPSFFLEEKKASFAKGDKVAFVGSKQGDGVIVREITKDGTTTILRDKAGIPGWSGGRRGPRR